MELKLSEKTIDIPGNVGELKLRKYFELARILETLPKENLEVYFSTTEGQVKFFDMIDIFIDDADDLPMSDLPIITETLINIIKNFNLPEDVRPYFEVGGVKYATRYLKDMNDLTNGEYISLKVYQEKFKGVVYDFAPYLLSILVRPCTEEKDEETGEIRYIQNKFDKKDIANLEWRANMFLNDVEAKDLMPVLNFFLTMSGITL